MPGSRTFAAWLAALVLAAAMASGANAGTEGWLLANRCIEDACYLKWARRVTPLEPGRFHVEIETAGWNWNDDPPVLGEPTTAIVTVACATRAVMPATGETVTVPSPTPADPDQDEIILWIGLCEGRKGMNGSVVQTDGAFR